MATVKQHYQQVLSDVYSWMQGGFENALQRNADFFRKHRITPALSGRAMDLGAGCGFQSIPLAERGYSVTAVDLDGKLLNELQNHANRLSIETKQADFCDLEDDAGDFLELAVCMTDTVLHLESKQKVIALFAKVYRWLESGGKFILTFRDLSQSLSELDRFIPVKQDESKIFTCFLEYEPETVKVHDLVYTRHGGEWTLNKSYYRKLRLSNDWLVNQLEHCGFKTATQKENSGLSTIIAVKPSSHTL